MPTVSVIIPNYNRAELIGETLSNLLKQTLPPYEIIIVDDGSTDDSITTIRSFGDKVKLLQQTNQGPGAARNAGLDIATGDFIQFQDSDDLLSLNKLETQVELLEQTGADIALGAWAHVNIRDRHLAFETCVLQQTMLPAELTPRCWLLRGWSTLLQSLLFRRSFLTKQDRYRSDLRYGEDMEFLYRILKRNPRVISADETITLYRLQSANRLSDDGGLPESARIVDWAKCLLAIAELETFRREEVDFATRSIFLMRLHKHLRYLRGVRGGSKELVCRLVAHTRRSPKIWLELVELWQRLAERIRLLRFGYRWMSGYRAGPASLNQLRLIDDLGFQLS